jgi:hypothetical protein
MSRRAAWACVTLLVAWSFAACNAGDIAVFSEPGAGASGLAGAGSLGGAGYTANAGSNASGGSDVASGAGAGAGALSGGSAPTSGCGGMEAAAGAADVVCHSNTDCPPNWLCLKQSCPDMEGVCEARPVCFDTTPAPVCGCNHVTYWNDCLRRQYGVSASTPGECGAGTHPCFMNSDCSDGATCSHLLPPNTACGGPPAPGTCWVTPGDCSATGDPRTWAPCPPPGGGPGGPCTSTCQAVQSGHPYMPLAAGAACP